MKFKLDENLGEREADLLRGAGHDATTVHLEGLCSRPDEAVFEAAVREDRALISLDHDFGNVLRIPPASSHGIVVLELPSHPTPDSIRQRLVELLAFMGSETLRNDLWIVEPVLRLPRLHVQQPWHVQAHRVRAPPIAEEPSIVAPMAEALLR